MQPQRESSRSGQTKTRKSEQRTTFKEREKLTAYVVPLIFLTVLVVAVFRKASPYSSFVQGAAQATDLIKTVLPYLVVVMVAVELFRESGVSAAVARFLSPRVRIFRTARRAVRTYFNSSAFGGGRAWNTRQYLRFIRRRFVYRQRASVIYGQAKRCFIVGHIFQQMQSKESALRHSGCAGLPISRGTRRAVLFCRLCL